VEKNTRVSRTYHNITAKYNVLYNGEESYHKGISKIESGYNDNYSEILPIFLYERREAVSLASSEMDRTIKKCIKVISLHSITTKPKVKNSKNLSAKQREFFNKKEYNLFVDDAYLLMGKAHFYKQEYEQASEIFHLIVNDFKNQPVALEAQLWLARLWIETGQSKEASDILTLLINNDKFPERLYSDLYTTYADYFLKQKNYIEAVNCLEKALSAEKHKKPLTRYAYLLAQLYEKTGDLKRASDDYALVIKMNPIYEMAFNARINRALAYEQGFGKAKDIENELNKMLHDDKNIEFQDQIYYALGNLAAKEGNNAQALDNYTKSIKANAGNEQQKARSYLTIAEYYYSIPDYPNAQAYYDSALSHLQPDYPGYEMLYSKSKSLTGLVKEINIIKLADSLMLLSRLPKDALYARVDAIIENERNLEETERQKQQEEQLDQQFGMEITTQNRYKEQSNVASTRWYFYNDAIKSMGYREFKLKWGDRRLEDHWQRSTKVAVVFSPGVPEDTEPEISDKSILHQNLSKLSREYYLASIPSTDSAYLALDKSIELGYFNMGNIYKNELKNPEKATEAYKELVKRYPASTYLLASYYNLYAIAKDQDNRAMIDFYKNTIVGQFPESMYTKVLTNPDYAKELETEEQIVQNYYKQTFEFYKNEDYPEVISRTEFAVKNYPESNLIPQFTYLNVLAGGKSGDRKAFRDNLTMIISKYPGSEIAADAQNLVDYIDNEHPELKKAEEIKLSQVYYQYSSDSPHIFAFILDKSQNANQLVFNIINYNLDHFDNLNLRVEILNLNNAHSLVLVKFFTNRQIASDYLKSINASDGIYKDLSGVVLTPIIISENNLENLQDDKSVDRYLIFYHENYK
jgi:tetratricopeptide (TPR) repeat protein